MMTFINIFGRPVPMYGICVLAGLFFSAFLIYLTTKKRKDFSYTEIINIPMFAFVGAFFGAHILYALTRINVIVFAFTNFTSIKSFFVALSDAFGGMVFYGGLTGGLLAAWLYCRFAKTDFGLYADIFAPAVPLFHAFGRIGCFFAGCCYGIESDWGVVYHNPILEPEVNDVTRIPIQLIESGLNILLVFVLILISRKNLKKGSVLSFYLLIYPVIRFTDEFFRGDSVRGHFLSLSTSQWISIFIFIFAVIMLLRRYVFKSTKDAYTYPVPTGTIPDGYVYNPYAGAVAPEKQSKLIYNTDLNEKGNG